jgi:hypothetical protein
MCGKEGNEEKEARTMGKPVELSADAVKVASTGRSKEVLGSGGPLPLTVAEVAEAAKGQSEKVIRDHLARKTRR